MAENFPNLIRNMNLHIQELTLSSKQGKLKEIHIKIYYHETVERQRKITLQAAREAIYKESSVR